MNGLEFLIKGTILICVLYMVGNWFVESWLTHSETKVNKNEM